MGVDPKLHNACRRAERHGRRAERADIAERLERRIAWLNQERDSGVDRERMAAKIAEANHILEIVRRGL